MTETPQQGFKRINFFKGFLTTEKDWNDAERYHIDKRRLHNKVCHGRGIVPRYSGQLRVNARKRGEVRPRTDAARMANYLTGAVLGLMALVRSPAPRAAITHYLDGVLSLLHNLQPTRE